MPQSPQKLDTICETFRDLAAQGATWVTIPELVAEVERRHLRLSRALIGDYVRRHCINDLSNQNASPKHYLTAPRFVISEPQNRRGRKYRLLSKAEQDAFLRDPREDWHERSYAELAAHYAAKEERPVARHSAHRAERAGKTSKPPDERIKVHELARELRVHHRQIIEAAQRLGAEASLPKSRLDETIAAHLRTEFGPATQRSSLRAATARAPRQVSHHPAESRPKPEPDRAPKKTRSAAVAHKAHHPVSSPASRATHHSRKSPSPAPVAIDHKPTRRESAHGHQAKQLTAIVDVSNVTREERDEKGRAKLASFLSLLGQLEKSKVKVIAIADAGLWGQIDREEEFKDCCRRGIIKQAPSRTEADVWILEKAREGGGYIISRDTFRDRIEKYPGIRERIVTFMVFDGEVMLDPEHHLTGLIHQAARKKTRKKK